MEENGRKGSSRETEAHRLSIAEVIDPKFVQTEAYIGAQCIGNYKKKKQNKTKSYYKDKMGRNKN